MSGKEAFKWSLHYGPQSASISCLKLSDLFFVSHIGNAGSAFVELLVGSSMWTSDRDYTTLLPSTMLMTPTESKSGKNNEGVKMLDGGENASSIIHFCIPS